VNTSVDEDLRLLIVHLRGTNEDHAVTAVRYGGRWLILDNRTLDIRQDVNAAEFDPLFVVDGEGVKRMTKLASKPRDPWTKASPATGYPWQRPSSISLDRSMLPLLRFGRIQESWVMRGRTS
jgi:hypothetical protein